MSRGRTLVEQVVGAAPQFILPVLATTEAARSAVRQLNLGWPRLKQVTLKPPGVAWASRVGPVVLAGSRWRVRRDGGDTREGQPAHDGAPAMG